MRKRAELARQTRHSAGDEPNLGPGPVFAVITISGAKLERDVVETADLLEIVSKLGNLLLALLGLDLAGWQWWQPGDRSAGGAHQDRM